MSKIDQYTKKKALRGNTRSFAMNHSPRKWELNLQSVCVKCGKGKKRMRVSARTLKTLKRKKLLYVASKKASKTQPTISAE